MAVGYEINKSVLDNRAGFLVETLRDTLAEIEHYGVFLDANADGDLIAHYGYTQDDVNILRSAFNALRKLGRICNAQDTQADANDFMFFAKQLTGVQ